MLIQKAIKKSKTEISALLVGKLQDLQKIRKDNVLSYDLCFVHSFEYILRIIEVKRALQIRSAVRRIQRDTLQ